MRIQEMKTKLTKLQSIFLAALMVFFAASCDNGGFNGPKEGKAQFKVHLTDAPGNYDEVNIDIQGMRIHYAPNGSDTASSDTTMESGEWIDLPVEPTRVNLLDLTNGIDTLLASAELDPGHYSELRLMLGTDNDVVMDSTTYDLQVPSGQQSGYKIKFNTELTAGEGLNVMVDFDAARSVHQAGNSGKYMLRPVLKAFVSDEDETEVGSINGVIEPVEADATVYAIMDEDTSGSTQPNEDGAFLLQGLEMGTYDLSVSAANEQYNDTTVAGVNVEQGDETDVGTISLSSTGQ